MNYYLVDSVSNPVISSNVIAGITSNSNQLSIITSSNLKNQVYFKNLTKDKWDFKNIWVYVNHVNWDYPVLRSIYGMGTSDINVTIYNPHLYTDTTMQLGNLQLDMNSIIYVDASGIVRSDYAEIVDDTEHPGNTKLVFTYSVVTGEVANIIASNTEEGLISSVLFGRQMIAGTEEEGILITEDATFYEELSDTANSDVIKSQVMENKYYGLLITFNERKFNVKFNATLTAEDGTDGVLDSDYMTIVLVHKTNAGVVDFAYTLSLKNGETITLTDMFNGNLDVEYEVDSNTYTTDEFGTYSIYIYYPIFYLNDSDNTDITTSNTSNNLTLVRRVDEDDNLLYDFYDNLNSVIKDTNLELSYNYLGTFTLDTLTRDVEINITINKSLEYWLHASTSNR
jgi:hypothetical protein